MRLIITDGFTKAGSAIDVGGYSPAARVIEVLSRLVSGFGASTAFRRDNELFLDCRTVDRLFVDGVNKLWQNALTESLLNGSSTRNASVSNGCLSCRSERPHREIIRAFAALVVQRGRALTYQTPDSHAPSHDPLRAASGR